MDNEHRWQAVQARQQHCDGMFVYAVKSTGIYCRPSCPSRRPRQEQVAFFDRPEAAEQAGFRACRRCHPNGTVEPDPQVQLVERACQYIEGRAEPVTLADLGVAVGSSPYHLQRTFKRIMGISPRQYAEAHRLDRLKAGLRDGDDITGALYDAGYGSSSRLYERSNAELGMTPAAYQRGGTAMQIHYTITNSPFGRLLVAATERGVCAVSLGDDDAALEAELRSEYPAAEITRDNARLNQWVAALIAHLSGEQPRLSLPLDIQATAFQRRVWQALQAIPYGSTQSYREVAEAIGAPTAARAVAQACATNPVALVIPCHRVVRAGGELGGYRWGVSRKQALLAREALG